MQQDQAAAPAVKYEPLQQADVPAEFQDPIQKALNETREDRDALERLLSPLFKTLWTDFLNVLFEVFPHDPGDKSDNERFFNALRHRVLRVGNDQVRALPMILKDFVMYRVRKTEIKRISIRQTVPAGIARVK
jgi:hypothetical protein